jgi:hypothetical protein
MQVLNVRSVKRWKRNTNTKRSRKQKQIHEARLGELMNKVQAHKNILQQKRESILFSCE